MPYPPGLFVFRLLWINLSRTTKRLYGSYLFQLVLSVANVSMFCRVPHSVKEGRFGNWLANARDWNISRNRYWGTPLPLWASEDMEEVRLEFLRDVAAND